MFKVLCLLKPIWKSHCLHIFRMNNYSATVRSFYASPLRSVPSSGMKERDTFPTDSSERLQKFLSNSGIASRRHAEELISSGRVKCSGIVVTTLGTKIFPEKDVIEVDGKVVYKRSCFRWVMVNKPFGLITTARDDRGRRTVCDLVKDAHKDGLVPVGRLDQASTGLLLLTNETNWIHKLLHPKFGHSKEYIVCVQGRVEEKTLDKLRRGVLLPGEEKATVPAVFKAFACYADRSYIRVVIREGKKRQIRRMFLTVGHIVLSLERIRFGSLLLPTDLKPGKWRDLSPSEVTKLKTELGHFIKGKSLA
ncbi:ribosomal large subunit pseudouridine synthase B [Galdieria sulphuraria]|uniref:Ribosomal large subunit pseudouridine synthase B n=1 Tax=Galdieria sulphuraria TaxID=130081 RepID=M2XV48_GALSU|nr:ribosomal large subunit pseudouridine synthase B [Galdieria sulphuraria]EME27528.1 ribosomal large subunit pseudouridine synthase B [Galdieria sulphuraria]|eukprot:XP_005704048.1 ribosomal large subunit pseudouridine synthase B [Galdieria sulphuraria]